MAAAVAVDSKAMHLQFWDGFRKLADRLVWECNAIAGESLWRVKHSSDPTPGFTVQASAQPDDSLECRFDLERGIVTCRPGHALRTGVRRFQVILGTASRPLLRLKTRHNKAVGDIAPECVTAEEALARLLDQLVPSCRKAN